MIGDINQKIRMWRSMGLAALVAVLLSLVAGAVAAGGGDEAMAGKQQACDKLQTQLAAAQEKLKTVAEKRRLADTSVEADLTEVKRLKQELESGGGFLKQHRLESLLQRSRDGVRELEDLKAQEQACRREALSYAAALEYVYNELIDGVLSGEERSADEASRLAGWIVERHTCQELYFGWRDEEKGGRPRAKLDLATVAGQLHLAREIVAEQMRLIEKELLRIEEKLDTFRTERSHWLRLRDYMHRLSQRRGDPVMDEGSPAEPPDAGAGRKEGLEGIEAEIRGLETRRRGLLAEKTRLERLLASLGAKP